MIGHWELPRSKVKRTNNHISIDGRVAACGFTGQRGKFTCVSMLMALKRVECRPCKIIYMERHVEDLKRMMYNTPHKEKEWREHLQKEISTMKESIRKEKKVDKI